MLNLADLPETIPIFPLPGALLLPRARLPLHIFEPRYLAMIDDVLKTSTRLIGMVQPFEGAQGSQLHAIGCAGRLTAFSETEDGRYMITLSGASRFRVVQEVEGFVPYRRCDVAWTGFERDMGAVEKDPGLERDPFLDLLNRFFQSQGLSTDWDSVREAEDELLINSISMLCPFSPEDKQALLEAPTLADAARDAGDADRVRPRRRERRRGDAVSGKGDGEAPDPGRPAPAFDPRMLEALVCPQTHGPLHYDAARQELVSRQAGLAFPIRDGIPVMLVDEARVLD